MCLEIAVTSAGLDHPPPNQRGRDAGRRKDLHICRQRRMLNVCIKSSGFLYRLELTMALVAGPTALSPLPPFWTQRMEASKCDTD